MIARFGKMQTSPTIGETWIAKSVTTGDENRRRILPVVRQLLGIVFRPPKVSAYAETITMDRLRTR